MDKDEIILRLDECIGVSAFYIGKAFKISKYIVHELTETVTITAIPFKQIEVKFSDMEQFFSDYQHVFAPKKPIVIAEHHEQEPEYGMSTRDSKGSTLAKTNNSMNKSSSAAPVHVDVVEEAIEVAEGEMMNTEDIKVTISDLKNLLLQNIKRVQKDPKYIPQAKSINNDVNSIINLAKLQITMIKSKP